jgi:hypothetical protein
MPEGKIEYVKTLHGGGYRVLRHRDPGLSAVQIGVVVPFHPPSAIRRGRAQVSPWWQPLTPEGAEGPECQTRKAAAAWLAEQTDS